jgi:hypothetical protein
MCAAVVLGQRAARLGDGALAALAADGDPVQTETLPPAMVERAVSVAGLATHSSLLMFSAVVAPLIVIVPVALSSHDELPARPSW